jgi:glycosyltransferase involved in cell wall biosynthesis
VPLYNKELSVERSIRSILNQSYKDFEVIVVDDGSTDRSLSVIQAIEDPRIRIEAQANGGVSVARNRGVAMAKHEHIAFLDADDEWHPEYLLAMNRVLEAYPDSDWWATSYVRATKDSREALLAQTLPLVKPEVVDYFERSVKELVIHISSLVVLKSAMTEIGGFPVGIAFGEDQDLFCRFAVRGKLPWLNQALSLYYNDTENRACSHRKVQPMPPFYRDHESLMLEKQTVGTASYWMQEYLIERYLTEVSLCAQTDGAKRQGFQWLRLCARTKTQRFRYFKAYVYLMMPSSFVRRLIQFVSSR